MAAIGMVLGRIIAWVIGSLIFKLLAAFGVGIAVMTGVNALIEGAFDEIQSLSSGVDPNVLAILGMLRIDDAISVIAGAVSVRISLRTLGIGGGEIRKLVFNGPSVGTP